MNVLELFAGIGGLSLGLQRAGMSIVGHVEIDPFARAVLHKHWPEVPNHDDVRTALDWWRSEPRPQVDVIAGGYPCQPESTAGRRLGTADARWLWPEFARIIYALRPRWVIGENVDGHRSAGLRFVLRDLDRLGYTATTGTIRACEVGAPHARPRVFTVAYANGLNGEERLADWPERAVQSLSRVARPWPDPTDWVASTARDHRVVDGISGRVDEHRVRTLGNAVVPAVAEHIGRIVAAADQELTHAPVR